MTTDDDYDLNEDEKHVAPSCDDCGRYAAKEWNKQQEEWVCPYCQPEDESDEG